MVEKQWDKFLDYWEKLEKHPLQIHLKRISHACQDMYHMCNFLIKLLRVA